MAKRPAIVIYLNLQTGSRKTAKSLTDSRAETASKLLKKSHKLGISQGFEAIAISPVAPDTSESSVQTEATTSIVGREMQDFTVQRCSEMNCCNEDLHREIEELRMKIQKIEFESITRNSVNVKYKEAEIERLKSSFGTKKPNLEPTLIETVSQKSLSHPQTQELATELELLKRETATLELAHSEFPIISPARNTAEHQHPSLAKQ